MPQGRRRTLNRIDPSGHAARRIGRPRRHFRAHGRDRDSRDDGLGRLTVGNFDSQCLESACRQWNYGTGSSSRCFSNGAQLRRAAASARRFADRPDYAHSSLARCLAVVREPSSAAILARTSPAEARGSVRPSGTQSSQASQASGQADAFRLLPVSSEELLRVFHGPCRSRVNCDRTIVSSGSSRRTRTRPPRRRLAAMEPAARGRARRSSMVRGDCPAHRPGRDRPRFDGTSSNAMHDRVGPDRSEHMAAPAHLTARRTAIGNSGRWQG